MKKILKTKPFVFFDVDGVLRKGKSAIPGAKEAILKLKDKDIPLAIITNGGGEPEYKRAEAINNILGLNNQEIFNGENVFLCHSPMQSSLLKNYEGHVLITGTGDIKSVMNHYNFNNFITVEEYAQIFPNIFPKFFVDQE